MSGYEYDIFISYSRHGSAREWMQNHFLPALNVCLADEIAPTPMIYVDYTMPKAVDWPSSLQRALQRSKIMVQVLAPHYFQSQWCMAEWHSMRERQRMLGLTTVEIPQGLICSVLYADSQNFPPDGRNVSWWDFKKFAVPFPAFRKSEDYVPFFAMVRALAADIVELLKQVPDWQPDWPIIEMPSPVLMPPAKLPRFGR
ncbi:TIR domain-containing protein [Kutzneria sp. NPDC051319]|uniref:TIR domain-containing protein n=1 Tax=Kutzneria sp. NPDC051319 TaxID=3155047 RepID=UPI00341AC44D